MKCDSTGTFLKKIIKATGLSPGMFNGDLSYTFNAKEVHTTDPKEIDKMFAELDAHVAKYKKDLRDQIENAKPRR